ncbi:MAG: site-specific DNA-methyltransferase [Actinobacteria bacterium]|nr:site-specific DNA-methyltransferase [Actinomycetota bacterium]
MSTEQLPLDKIMAGDCLKILAGLPDSCADLIVADPPYNIGYKYDRYNDSQKHEDYCAWSGQWMRACQRVLADTGSMYVAIGDDYAAELRIIGREIGLTLRNWLVWHYTFGQNTKNKFARSHIHIFYFVADPKEFTFNDDSVRILSDRQKQYADKRANPAGKIPDDTWVVFPRVCGTFGERAEGPNQLPEALLARIIRASSNPGNLVLDPFCGAGTTATVAAQLDRRYLSIDISAEYVHKARLRVANTLKPTAGYKLDGLSPLEMTELIRLYQENEIPAGRLLAKPHFVALFTEQLNRRLAKCSQTQPAAISPERIALALQCLATKNLLPVLRTDQPSLRSRPR